MWYGGSGDPVYGLYQIGYAYSPDGIHWTKYTDNPVLTTGPDSSWDNGSPEGPTVVMVNDTLKMWYAGLDTIANGQTTDFEVNIGYAWSLDGVNWTKHPDNPVLTTGGWGSWDDVVIQDAEVLIIEGVYHIWYTGFPEWPEEDGGIPGMSQIGHAYSEDGVHWTKDTNNPVVPNGAPGTWDAAVTMAPAVIWDGDTLRMWYTGIDTVDLPEWPEPFYWDIGSATSPLNTATVTEWPFQLPADFSLFQNYPNPFNSSTTINYQLPKATTVKISIYNIAGKLVETLENEYKNAGFHSVVWDVNTISSGLYFYRIEAGEYADTKKCVILK